VWAPLAAYAAKMRSAQQFLPKNSPEGSHDELSAGGIVPSPQAGRIGGKAVSLWD
jgi:hypothetical protein